MHAEPERRYFFSNSRDVRHGALPKEDPGHYGRTNHMQSVQAMNCFDKENDTVSGRRPFNMRKYDPGIDNVLINYKSNSSKGL